MRAGTVATSIHSSGVWSCPPTGPSPSIVGTPHSPVQQPSDTGLESVRRKLAYDLAYVDGMGPWLDLRIILATPLKCLGVPFARIGVVLRLPDSIGPFGPDIPCRRETVRPEALALEAHPGAV